jgi:hypothetical protein
MSSLASVLDPESYKRISTFKICRTLQQKISSQCECQLSVLADLILEGTDDESLKVRSVIVSAEEDAVNSMYASFLSYEKELVRSGAKKIEN